MPHRHRSKAIVDPNAPRATGVCDRCGFWFLHHTLRFQNEWAGTSIIQKNLLVCSTCYDEPSPAYKTTFVPPDEQAIPNARPEPYSIDEA